MQKESVQSHHPEKRSKMFSDFAFLVILSFMAIIRHTKHNAKGWPFVDWLPPAVQRKNISKLNEFTTSFNSFKFHIFIFL